ncbi:hypothetical protein LXL04_012533 [Taraxacum kok-saghyz]
MGASIRSKRISRKCADVYGERLLEAPLMYWREASTSTQPITNSKTEKATRGFDWLPMEKLSLIVADLSFPILGVDESGGMTSILRREKKTLRLDGMIGNGTAATEIDEFTAGDEIGIGTCSGVVCQRQTPTPAPLWWPIRLFAAFSLWMIGLMRRALRNRPIHFRLRESLGLHLQTVDHVDLNEIPPDDAEDLPLANFTYHSTLKSLPAANSPKSENSLRVAYVAQFTSANFTYHTDQSYVAIIHQTFASLKTLPEKTIWDKNSSRRTKEYDLDVFDEGLNHI